MKDTGHIANHFDCAAQLFPCSIIQKAEGLSQHHPKGKYVNPQHTLKTPTWNRGTHCLGHVLPLKSLAGWTQADTPEEGSTLWGSTQRPLWKDRDILKLNNHRLFKCCPWLSCGTRPWVIYWKIIFVSSIQAHPCALAESQWRITPLTPKPWGLAILGTAGSSPAWLCHVQDRSSKATFAAKQKQANKHSANTNSQWYLKF